MKRIISLFLLVTSLAFTGCYELDRAPFDEVSSETFWLTEDQCFQGVTGVYASLLNTGAFNEVYKQEVGTDVVTGVTGQYGPLYLGTYTGSTGFVIYKWQHSYNTIQRANIAIRNLTDADIDQDTKDQMIGEMKFLRSLSYFELVKHFGGVPIYDETTDITVEYATLMKTRSTETEVYEFCIKDFTEAAAILPISWDENGRATKSAAYAMIGKINLYMGNYTAAITNFEEVLDSKYGHELNPVYENLFLPGTGAGDNDESSEMIFAVQCIGGVGQDYGITTGLYVGNRGSYGSGWNSILPSTKLVDKYEWIDGRKFDWDELIPGYNDSDEIKQSAFYCTMNSAVTAVTKYPDLKETVEKAYDPTLRDPRLAATIITPFSTYHGWVSDADAELTLIFGVNESGSKVYPSYTNGFINNNNSAWQTYFFRKFVPQGDMNGQLNDRLDVPINYPVVRLADVYLMLAEAYNENGDQATAVSYVNKVRARAGIALINNGDSWMAATTKDEVFERIFHERALELVLEHHREGDLRRWKLSESLLSGTAEYGVVGGYMTTSKFDAGRDYLWPIPDEEIEMNPNLEQNPGW